jgi:hypothetical protein
MAKISAMARRELLEAVSERYRKGSTHEKRRILDEFVALTGHHRKHAIRLLRTIPDGNGLRKARSRSRVYDEAVRTALTVLWEASDRVCSKRLKPLVPVLVPALERHGHMKLDEAVRARVFAVSAATIDRVLAPVRAASSGRRARGNRKPAVRRQIPIRTFADWNDPAPGYLEADLVAHGGESMAGSFTYTFVLTDIASGWTECIPLLVREATLVVDSLDRLSTLMPFPLRGIDTDNGSEFVNEALLGYCKEKGIEFTRSRPPSKKRPSLGGAEERIGRPPPGRLSEARRNPSGRGARSSVRRLPTVRKFLPAVIQACREDAHRRSRQQAVSRPRDSVRTSSLVTTER